MCIRDSLGRWDEAQAALEQSLALFQQVGSPSGEAGALINPVSYTHLRAHETVLDLVCRLLLEKKNNTHRTTNVALSTFLRHAQLEHIV